jgi:hypothetical protein
MRIDSSGRLGLGVVPSDFHSNNSAVFQLKDGNSIFSRTGGQFLGIFQNIKYNSSDVTQYIANGLGSAYFQAAGEHKFYTVSSGTANNNATLSERMRINSSGNVGIGSTSPTEKLEINLGTNKIVQFTGGIGQIGNVAGVYAVNDAKSEIADFGIMGNTLKFASGTAASGAERMRIDSSGQIHIGNTGAPSTNGFSVLETYQSTTYLQIAHNVTGAEYSYFNFQHNNNNIGTIKQNSAGNAISFNTSSDYRLKENVVSISDGITRLKTLKPSRFNFKNDTDTTLDGFLAHEVQSVVPEAISGEKDAVKEDGSIDPQGIDQSKLVPLLTAALQEAIAKIEVLETKVAALEAA